MPILLLIFLTVVPVTQIVDLVMPTLLLLCLSTCYKQIVDLGMPTVLLFPLEHLLSKSLIPSCRQYYCFTSAQIVDLVISVLPLAPVKQIVDVVMPTLLLFFLSANR